MRNVLRGPIAIAITLIIVLATNVSAGDNDKVLVCKYVGTPGVNERLQTGNNPIDVSVNAIPGWPVVGYFADGQNRSYVLSGGETCPIPPTPTPTPTPTPNPTPDPTPTFTPTAEPSATPTPTSTAEPTTAPTSDSVSTPIPVRPLLTLPPTDTE